MKEGRRTFIKSMGALSLAGTMPAMTTGHPRGTRNGRMKLTFHPYDLQLRHTFTVSGYSRKTTPVVLAEIE